MQVQAFDRTYEGLKPGSPARVSGEGAAFDRTYEGLKLNKRAAKRVSMISFDRTYEGLKPWTTWARPESPRSAFDRTYEGLKPHLELLALLLVEPLLTVPMRV